MRFLAGVIVGIVLSTSAGGFAGSGNDPSGFNRSHQEKRYDYFRERQQQDVQKPPTTAAERRGRYDVSEQTMLTSERLTQL
jgi:hypothetical protein